MLRCAASVGRQTRLGMKQGHKRLFIRLLHSSNARFGNRESLKQDLAMSTRHPGGFPDFIEKWGRGPFKKVGAGLVITSLAGVPLALDGWISFMVPALISGFTGLYWKMGLSDMAQTNHSIRQNFPVLCRMRYLFEGVRPEIQQYLIESDDVAVPFSRHQRSIIYQRAKGAPDTRALGTKRDVYKEGYEWINHSMFPTDHQQVLKRVDIGGAECTQPYSASLLNISAMSYGALSGNAISALNLGAKQGGFYHNTGEGGISKFHLLGGDVVWNIGTGYFACGESGADGVRRFSPDMFQDNARRPNVKMIELKLSQGAKPSHGGILPASKITPIIAEARGLGPPPWTDCNSPPRHTAFSTLKQMMEFIRQLRELSGGKPVGIKLCVGQPQEIAAMVHAMLDTGITPDFITVDGAEGGTGAAPSEFQDSVGMPLSEGLRLIDGMLTGAGLRSRIKLIASGKVYNGFSLVRSLALGADLCNSARSMMFALGCIQALKCNSNKCPTGITTQDPSLESALDVEAKSLRVANFHAATIHAACEIIAAAGCTSSAEIGPQHLMRRESGIHVKSYADMHNDYFKFIPDGSLVDESKVSELSESTRRWWKAGGEFYKSTA